MYESILAQIRTQQDLDRLDQGLASLKNQLYSQANSTQDELIKQELSLSIAEEVLLILKNNPKLNLENLIQELTNALEKLPVIQITIAFDPRAKTIDRIHSWISQNISKGFVLDIQVDESIVGGAIITNQGKYIDLSLRNILEGELNSQKPEYMKIIKQA